MHRAQTAVVSVQARWAVRPWRRRERGSQSLEWVGLGGVITAVMIAALKVAESHGGVVGQAFVDNLSHAVEPGR